MLCVGIKQGAQVTMLLHGRGGLSEEQRGHQGLNDRETPVKCPGQAPLAKAPAGKELGVLKASKRTGGHGAGAEGE